MLNYAVSVTLPTTTGRKKTKTFCPGTVINMGAFYNQYSFRWTSVPNKIGDKQEILKEIYLCEESDDFLTLKKGTLYSVVEEDDMLSFEEDWKSTLSFDKSKNLVENESTFKDMKVSTNLDVVSLHQIVCYLNKVIEVNKNVQTFFANHSNIIFENRYALNNDMINCLNNVVYNSSFALLEIEKMINAGQGKLLLKNFRKPEFKLEQNTKKLSQSVGLPPFALPIIKKLRIEDCIDSLSKINKLVDGNSLKLLLELVDNYSSFLTLKIMGTAKDRTLALSNFFENLYEILCEGYNLQDILNYVLRQRMYWNKVNAFGFPFEDTKLFVDYLALSKNNSIKCEKYPQNLRKMHDILVQNLSDYDPSKDAGFKTAVASYAKYENELTKDGYAFIVPYDIKALIQEGNDLHHCIGSYIDRIIEGKSRIFFMREISSKKTSFVTVELDNDCNIVEIKGMFNQEPEANIISIANKWAGICKRIK